MAKDDDPFRPLNQWYDALGHGKDGAERRAEAIRNKQARTGDDLEWKQLNSFLAGELMLLGRDDEREAILRRQVEKYPGDAMSVSLLANFFRSSRRDMERALPFHDEAVRLADRNGTLRIYVRQERLRTALEIGCVEQADGYLLDLVAVREIVRGVTPDATACLRQRAAKAGVPKDILGLWLKLSAHGKLQ